MQNSNHEYDCTSISSLFPVQIMVFVLFWYRGLRVQFHRVPHPADASCVARNWQITPAAPQLWQLGTLSSTRLLRTLSRYTSSQNLPSVSKQSANLKHSHLRTAVPSYILRKLLLLILVRSCGGVLPTPRLLPQKRRGNSSTCHHCSAIDDAVLAMS